MRLYNLFLSLLLLLFINGIQSQFNYDVGQSIIYKTSYDYNGGGYATLKCNVIYKAKVTFGTPLQTPPSITQVDYQINQDPLVAFQPTYALYLFNMSIPLTSQSVSPQFTISNGGTDNATYALPAATCVAPARPNFQSSSVPTPITKLDTYINYLSYRFTTNNIPYVENYLPVCTTTLEPTLTCTATQDTLLEKTNVLLQFGFPESPAKQIPDTVTVKLTTPDYSLLYNVPRSLMLDSSYSVVQYSSNSDMNVEGGYLPVVLINGTTNSRDKQYTIFRSGTKNYVPIAYGSDENVKKYGFFKTPSSESPSFTITYNQIINPSTSAQSSTFNFNSTDINPISSNSSMTQLTTPFPTNVVTLDLNLIDSFSPVTITYQQAYSMELSYPFGFKNNSWVYEFSTIDPLYINKGKQNIKVSQRNSEQSYDIPATAPIVDTQAPQLISIQMTPASVYSYIIQMVASDDEGIDLVIVDGVVYFSELIQSSFNGGPNYTFVFEHTFVDPSNGRTSINRKPIIQIQDYAMNILNVNPHLYNLNFDSIDDAPIHPFNFIKGSDFTHFEFIPKVVDTTNSQQLVTVLFNITDSLMDTSIEPQLNIILSHYNNDGDDSFALIRRPVASYSPTDKMFRAEFIVPQYTDNFTAIYNFDGSFSSILQSDLISTFGSSATLTLINKGVIDYTPPYVESFIPTITGDKVSLNITIYDYPNGLVGGEWKIVSLKDGREFVFDLTPNSSTPVTDGRYQFNLEISLLPYCIVTGYKTTYIKLIDKGGWTSIYPTTSSNQFSFDPLSFKFPLQSGTSFNVDCTVQGSVHLPTPDTETPSLNEIRRDAVYGDLYGNQYDLHTTDPITITYLVAIVDDVAYNKQFPPTMYFQSRRGFFKTNQPTITDEKSEGGCVYYYNVTYPYAFGGNSGFLVSVYGFLDYAGNIKGYSTEDLYQFSVTSSFAAQVHAMTNVSLGPTIPILDSTTQPFRSGGSVTLRGKNLYSPSNTVVYVDYNDGNGEQVATVITSTSVFIEIDVSSIPSSSSNINVRIVKDGASSNPISITPAPYLSPVYAFPEPEKPIPCTNDQCNGRGQCQENGQCLCESPWYGPSCQSKVNNEMSQPPKPANEHYPVIILDNTANTTDGSGDGGVVGKTRSIIEVSSLRELNTEGQTVNSFNITDGWTFEDLTDYSNAVNGEVDSTTYHYYTTINNATLMNVTIQWFRNQSNIVFAEESLDLPPLSTKISMALTEYPFESFTNTLQIVIRTTFESEDGECSKQVYGLGDGSDQSDLQWIKLSVDDKNIYGQFIRRGIIDGRTTSIRNELLADQEITKTTHNSTTAYIGINVPYFSRRALLDPQFSSLVDVDLDGSGGGVCQSKPTKTLLTTGAISGIVVGAVVIASVGTGGFIYRKKIKQQTLQRIRFQTRLQQFMSPDASSSPSPPTTNSTLPI